MAWQVRVDSTARTAPALQAVDTIHRERIVHSDLKPANFLVVEGQLKLIDFGIAKAIQSGALCALCVLCALCAGLKDRVRG